MMKFTLKLKCLMLVCLMILIGQIRGQVTWTDLTGLKMGQTSIYDQAYIPLNVDTPVDITYKTSFPTNVPIAWQALVISGFENYLSFEMIMKVTIIQAYQSYVKINVYVGAQTYVKQLNVNYMVMQNTFVGYSAFAVSMGDYRTLALDDFTLPATDPRKQAFNNQTSPFSSVVSVFSAIHGIEYYNTDGSINQVNVNTWHTSAPNIINHEITVGQKGRLNYIRLTTILISPGFYPSPNNYIRLGISLQTTITSTDGFYAFNKMSASNLFSQTDNSMIFGIRGFYFTIEDTRLFLLEVATQTDFRTNLQTNTFNQYTELAVFVAVQRACPAGKYFYVEGYSCVDLVPDCDNLLQDTNPARMTCRNCDSTCVGCTGSTNMCKACAPGKNRKNTTAPPHLCPCDIGYVQVPNTDVCGKCSDLIPGCLTCSFPNVCTNCGDPTIYESYTVTTGTNQGTFCRCKGGKYLVSGICLSFPGCLIANIYITGQFCQDCDEAHNFEKNLVDNSTCKCKTATFLNPTTKFCEDICTDSKTPASPANAADADIICDDGNLQSGDGCSSACRQQFGYLCSIDTPGGISNCAQKQQIKITYLYTQKNLIGNQATIVFYLTPQQHFLLQNTFQNSVAMNIPGTKKIKFDPVNSLIMITVDYTANLQGSDYMFNFTFTGLDIYSPDIDKVATLNGMNAKLVISQNPRIVNIITYVTLAVSAFALALALTASFLGEKMMGIELILPAQAAFFTMATFPKTILSPISALWSLKFSNGYNSLQKFDLSTNYMLDNRVTIMQYSGQYLLNYNIMFLPLVLVIVVIGFIAIRIAWLERQQRRIQGVHKKRQEDQKGEPKKKKKKVEDKQKDDERLKDDDKQTEDQTQKDDQPNLQALEQELQDTRQNIKNWKNFMYMIFDRFFAIFIITAMMKVIFCFYVQLSNLTYTAEVYDNSLNAGFFFLTYATIVTGLYAIIYDYKTDKLILFTCNKGKYAIFYLTVFLGFIIVLGAVFQTIIGGYLAAIFSLMTIILIIYQAPYGLTRFDFQTIIAIICQVPFIATASISLILSFSGDNMKESTAMIFSFVIVGSIGLSIIVTMIRLIKIIDCKKISCVEFTDRKKDNGNDKNKKKNKVMLLELEMDKDWDEYSQDSVRAAFIEKKKYNRSDDLEPQNKAKSDKKNGEKKDQKKVEKQNQDEEDDEEIDELEKIKLKLRKQLKQKKALGKIK